MIKIRKSQERGQASHGWLNSFHTFSFADYYDPNHMGFGPLRVINEDRIQAATGFGTHGHQNMEIISYVIEGALEHKDSMGSDTIIVPGEVQRMSAGTGVRHSEYNHLKDQTTHFLQIWIMPELNDIRPSYAQKSFESDFKTNDLILVASKNGDKGSLSINQDVNMYAAKSLMAGEKKLSILKNRKIWIQVIKGEIRVDTSTLSIGDGAAIWDQDLLVLSWPKDTEFIVFDLPF